MRPPRLYEALWTEHDHGGRSVSLTWGNDGFGWIHIKYKRRHVLYEDKAFQADMRRAVHDPLLVHHDPDERNRWIYYTCSGDCEYRDQALRVIVSRRPTKEYDVVWTAFLSPTVDRAGLDPSTPIEVDKRTGSKGEPCGNPRESVRKQRVKDRASRQSGFPIPEEQIRRLEGLKAELSPGQPTAKREEHPSR
jgi:hypothetical protein